MTSFSVVMLTLASLLVVVSLIQPLADRLKLPASVLLAAVGVAIGAASTFLWHTSLTNALNDVAEPFVFLPVNASHFLYGFLPILLFQAALTMDVRRMVEDAAPILVLAIVAVFVATIFIGFSLSALSDAPLLVCLLVGAIVATTDPSAVLAIFRDLGAPARLTRLVEGESLFNDAAAILLFTTLLSMLVSGREPDLAQDIGEFLVSFGGGLAAGFIFAQVAVWAVRLLGHTRAAEVTLTVALPYLVFILSDRVFEVSGVVATVSAGLAFGTLARSTIRPANWDYLQEVMEQMAFWASSLIFLLASILVPRLIVGLDWFSLVLIAGAVVASLASRLFILLLVVPPLARLRLSASIRPAYNLVIAWGALRGAVTLALALAVTENQFLPPEVKRFVAVVATGFVLFTLFVNGPTLRLLIRLLKLDRLSPLDLALRNQVLALSLAEVRDGIQATAREYELEPAIARSVIRPYEGRIAEASAAAEGDDAISDRDRLNIGLIALANRERELVLEHLSHQTVSPAVIEAMSRDVGRLVDAARTGGRIGYNRQARRMLRYTFGFRTAHFLHRQLRLNAPLVWQLSRRFERLLVERLVLDEVRRFNLRRLKPVFGERVAQLLGDVLRGRIEATSKALAALRLQYPDHAEALERRFLRQSGLRLELAAYEALFDEGLIGQELFDDLRRSVEEARREAVERVRLDLGLDTKDLIDSIELFRGLDPARIQDLARLFRPRLAVPGEVIIRKGDLGTSAYFISSGAVEVVLASQRIRLGRGDFFGEMALLKGRRRQADVVALTYCQLLVLDETDFQRFVAHNPDVKQVIDSVVAARTAMNRRSEQETAPAVDPAQQLPAARSTIPPSIAAAAARDEPAQKV